MTGLIVLSRLEGVAGPYRQLALAAGIVVVALTVGSVFSTLVVPRATSARLMRAISKALGKGLFTLGRHLRTYDAVDRLMSFSGPFAMVLVFVIWLAGLVLGYGLIAWFVSGLAIDRAFVISGSSVFTLGFVSGPGGGSQALDIVTAGTGLLVIALEIAYLPTLYVAFSTREAEVTLLATRAGNPAWGPEILVRAHRFGTMSELPALYASWERWAAAVVESHSSYPSLMWFRSPYFTRSWLSALIAMMDAAALQNALCPGTAPPQARLFLQMGTRCFRGLARALQIPFDSDPLPTDPIRLQRTEYLEGTSHLEHFGFPMERPAEDAWPHFAGWRVNYESIADALTRVIVPPPSPWQAPQPELGPVEFPRIYNRTPDRPRPEEAV